MTERDFYHEIEHPEVPWREYLLHVPVFYPNIGLMSVSFLAPTANVRAILPSNRMKPYCITPWHSLVSVTAYEYRESDIGPYNEVMIGIPVTIDEETPLFTGILRKPPTISMLYSHHLPVTTEIARVVGAEFAGYPKFVADIEFTEADGWRTGTLSVGRQHILTLRCRMLQTKPVLRYRVWPITFRRGYILRSEFVISEREMGLSKDSDDVRLELGDHQIADELRALNLGKVVSYVYCARAQGTLTPVIESFGG